MLYHLTQQHKNKLLKLNKKRDKSKKIDDNYKRFGIILPESAHKIQCKMCKKEFFGQSRASVMRHMKHKHDDVAAYKEIKNRYFEYCNFLIWLDRTMCSKNHKVLKYIIKIFYRMKLKDVSIDLRLSCRVCDFSTANVDEWTKHFEMPEPSQSKCRAGFHDTR